MNLADIKRRKEARRKSLANRRVSFALEATMHTFDVVEYMEDATSSTASSSEATRNAVINKGLSFKSPEPKQRPEDDTPSTPPEEEENLDKEESPANQRDVHQKKRRRSSTGFVLNKEEDPITSSPSQHSSPIKPISNDVSDDDMGDATMDLDELTVQSLRSGDSGDSSNARLDAALKQAAAQAGSQEYQDPNGDATMDLADDEVTHAFKPWVNKNRRDSFAVNRHIASKDQENVDPFQSQSAHTINDDDATQDMSMDITRAIGGIISKDSDNTAQITRSLKRRRSSNMVSTTESSGSPIQRPTTRKSLSRRQSTAEESVIEEVTMDFTIAVGKIHQNEDTQDSELTDDAMDLTVPIGRIKEINPSFSVPQSPANTELLEDLSMELTQNLGKSLLPPVPATPSPAKTRTSPRKSLLPPSITVERPHTPQKSPLSTKASPARRQTIQPSPRRSPRKSLGGVIDGGIKLQTPEQVKPTRQSPIAAPIYQTESTVELSFPPKSSSLADHMKLLSTPRKEILPSPALRPPMIKDAKVSPKKLATPKKSTTPKRTRTPSRSASPKKRVRIEESPDQQGEDESFVESVYSEGDKISLQDFLSMVNIRFMDLTTTKRRATGFPGADGMIRRLSVSADQEPSMENNVAAAAAIVPLLTMYQHVSLYSRYQVRF
jgi:kinetochore protein Spc7/SPC105